MFSKKGQVPVDEPDEVDSMLSASTCVSTDLRKSLSSMHVKSASQSGQTNQLLQLARHVVEDKVSVFTDPKFYFKFDIKKLVNEPLGLDLFPTGAEAVIPGVFVANVKAKGPCENYIQIGDQLMKIDGQAVTGKPFEEIIRLSKDAMAKTVCKLEIIRAEMVYTHLLVLEDAETGLGKIKAIYVAPPPASCIAASVAATVAAVAVAVFFFFPLLVVLLPSSRQSSSNLFLHLFLHPSFPSLHCYLSSLLSFFIAISLSPFTLRVQVFRCGMESSMML